MSLAIWAPEVLGYPRWEPYGYADARDVLVVRMTGGTEQRARRTQRRERTFRVSFLVEEFRRDRIDAFFVERGFGADSFLVEDPSRRFVRGLALGASAALQTAFVLPTSGDYGGAYPANTEITRLLDDGVAISRTVNPDTRTLTAAVAPGAGSVMTADVAILTRVVLRGTYEWAPRGEGAAWETSMTWEEVSS